MNENISSKKLPNSWVITTLGDLGIVVSGGTPSTNEPEYWGDYLPWITPADLSSYNEKYIARGRRNISRQGLNNSSAVPLPPGSLLFSSRAPIGYVVIAQNRLATNQGFKNIIPVKSTYIDYLYYYLQYAKQEAIALANGTTFLELSATNFSKIPVPLPPLNEQKRIVDKIEELLSELESSVQNLRKSKQQLQIHRQVLLKNAFNGKLTEDWRAANKYSSADLYLKILNQERSKKYDQLIFNWKKEIAEWIKNDRKEKRPSKPQDLVSYPSLSKDDIDKLPAIPAHWKWVRNNDLLFYLTSGSRDWKKYYSKDGAYFIRTQDIKTNELELNGAAYVKLPPNVEGKRSLVENGDLLITITGANVGKIAQIRNDIPESYVSQSVALLKPINKLLAPYLHLYFQSKTHGGKFIQNLVYGVGRPVLSLENIREVPVPICSLEEQQAIKATIDEQFSIIDNLEEAVNATLEKLELLRDSIYKKAFEGKLVTQEESDQNARELLKQIAFEKLEYLAQQTKEKKVREKTISMKNSLIDIIKKHFADVFFSVQDLKQKTTLSDEKVKQELFDILEKGKLLSSVFDTNKKQRLYKIKS